MGSQKPKSASKKSSPTPKDSGAKKTTKKSKPAEAPKDESYGKVY